MSLLTKIFSLFFSSRSDFCFGEAKLNEEKGEKKKKEKKLLQDLDCTIGCTLSMLQLDMKEGGGGGVGFSVQVAHGLNMNE